MKRIIVLFFMTLVAHSYAQYPPVTIPGSQVRRITSTIVTRQEYELQILLPANYTGSTKKLPVVYLMDAQWDFPLVKCIFGEYYYDGFVPEMIIVGVTWGGVHPDPDSLRARDYTPTKESRLPQSGGADSFLSFMKKELFPFIETNYKADPEQRILMGCSLGGLLTLYTMFTHTDMFTGYVAASPAVNWDNEVLYKYEKTFAEKKIPKPVRVFMTVGDVETSRSFFEKLDTFMIHRNYDNVFIRPKVLENTGHSGTKSETFSRGLQYIFERNKLKLSQDVLNKYAGTYESPGGDKIKLKAEDNQLVWYSTPQNKIELLADSETHFYATFEFFNLYFKMSSNKVEGFDWARYSGTQFIKKID